MKKDMQKLSCRILVILAALFLFWLHFALKDPLSYADQDAAACIWVRRFVDSGHNAPYKVLILGDSLANCSYIPNFLSGDSANISVIGSTPLLQYHILRRFLEHNPPPESCYISFADHILHTDWDFLNPASAQFFSLSEVREAMAEGKKYGKRFKAVPDYPVWEFYCLSPRVYQLSVTRGLLSGRKESNRDRLRHADMHAGAYMQPVTVSFGTYEAIQDSFSIAPVNEAYYRKILDLCASRGIRVRIIKLPPHPSIQYTDQYRKEFTDYYTKLKEDYPGITVAWFEHGLAEDCFVDTIGHMNLKGACLFSKMLARFYPGDFDAGSPLPDDLLAGLEEYRQAGFDSSLAEPAGSLADTFGN